MSKKNPKIEDISPASSLGSNSPKNMKQIYGWPTGAKTPDVDKIPSEMITPPEGISDHMSEKDFRKIAKYPRDKIMKSYGAKNYIPEISMEKKLDSAKLRKKLYGVQFNKNATKIQAAARGHSVRKRAKRTKKLVDGLKQLFGGRPKKTRKRRRKRRKKTRKRRKRKTKRRKKRRYTKRIQNIKEILSDKCSPKKDGEILKFTCYTKASLYKLKNIWRD